MKMIGILGTGVVGQTLGTKFIQLGYQVMMGSRQAGNEKAGAWASAQGPQASFGTFAEAAAFGETIFICTKGDATLEVLLQADPDNFADKTVIDVTNPLDFSRGMPPALLEEYANTHSLGEEVQKLLPRARVVKTLNMVNCEVMVDPGKTGGAPTMFISGNDTDAKAEVSELLRTFGWTDLLDLGDITTARGTEMLLPLWLRTYMALGTGYFAFKVVK
jgi:8-hydroxy-5-deazaflavin:NADPH oxidoreductase